MFQYIDPTHGKVQVLSQKEFDKKITKHSDCTMDSETIIDENKLHIERILCYSHRKDWFVEVKKL